MRRPTAIKLAASVGGVVACYTWKFDKNQSLCSAETVSYEWQNDWDNKQNLYDSKKKIGTHYIVLIRHGQYEERQDLDEDRKLTDIGRQQATMTGKRLNDLLSSGILPPIKKLYYSTMTRATETGKLILNQLPPSTPSQSCPLIQEGAVARPNPSAGASWNPSDAEFEEEGARVEAAFSKYFHRLTIDSSLKDNNIESNNQSTNLSVVPSQTTVLVCHGNVTRYLSLRALQLPTFAWLRLAVYNGSITILEIRPSGHVSLRCLGDVGHLSPELITYSLKK